MDYNKALKYIEDAGKFGSKLGLDNIKTLLDLVGNPQNKLKIIHVAGTNGKGSTCTFIANSLTNLGYKTGFYSSPYLEEFGERIRVDNQNISKGDLAKVITIVKEKIDYMVANGHDHPTEFEIITVVAYLYYQQKNVDFVVLEVGLGGRLDATNTCIPVISVITSISLDHTEYLGSTLTAIAKEKGGIIKPNTPVVVYDQSREVVDQLKEIATGLNSEIYITDNNSCRLISSEVDGQVASVNVFGTEYTFEMSILGQHQIKNLNTALTALKVLESKGIINLDNPKLIKGIQTAKWPGRFEVINKEPLTIIDGAHNEDGAKSLKDSLQTYLPNKKITLVIGMLKDKDIKGSLAHILPLADKVIITEPYNPRAASTKELREICKSIETDLNLNLEIQEITSVEEAVIYTQNRATKEEVIVYAGSLYMIGSARKELRRIYSF